MTFQAIADALNAEGIPTAHGGKWRPSTIVEEAWEREREPEPEPERE